MSLSNNSFGPGMIPVQTDTDAASVAGLMQSYVVEYASALIALANRLQPPTISPTFPDNPAPPVEVTTNAPSLQAVAWNVPGQPGAFSGTLEIGNYLPGPFTGVVPSLSFGTAPGQFTGAIPSSPSIDTNFVYPTVSITLPDPPTLLEIQNLQFTPISIPKFDTPTPTFSLLAPSLQAYQEGAFYTSNELSLVQSEIVLALTSDTDIGLSASTQQAMWDAAREREYRQMADALASLERDTEVLGYALPPGVFWDSQIKIQTEFGNTVAGLSRDIMVKQAELRLENVTKARELAVTLESKLIDYYNLIQQRAFEYAKYITESQVSIYNSQVQAFTAQIEGYKASIEAFNASIHALELYIEQLKAEISFQQTKAEIDTALVGMYKTQVDAAVATLDVYKTQVDIIQVEAQVEKLKIDTYSAQIQAFVGTVNAYTAQMEGYKTQVESQGVIANVYKTEVDAYAATVQAGVAEANVIIAGYEGQIKAYEAQLDGYKSALEAMTEQARAASLYNQSVVAEYSAEVQAVTAYNSVLTQQWETIAKINEEVFDAQIKAQEVNGQLYVATQNIIVEANKAGIQTAAQLGAAALNALHYSNNSNWSFSASEVVSLSNSTSTSTNTNYNESSSN
jgi:hypothetical protein